MEEEFDNLDTIELGDVHFGGVEDIRGNSDVKNALVYLKRLIIKCLVM